MPEFSASGIRATQILAKYGFYDKMTENKEFKHIVRIANTDLDGNKAILVALKKIKGVGYSFANFACKNAEVDINKKTGYLSDAEISKLDTVIRNPIKYNSPIWMLNWQKEYESGLDKHLIGVDLKFLKQSGIKRLQKIKSYRGLRHQWRLPLRGQRTRSNFRPNKGKVVGVKRRKGAKSGRV